MQEIDIKEIDLNSGFYHFTLKENLESIKKNGLVANIGASSQIINEQDARVYLSKGGKGLLGMKNSFIHKHIGLKVCEIPEEYRRYYDIEDFSSERIVTKEEVYSAMEKRMKDEIYFYVDAKEGEDYETDDMYGLNEEHDVKDIKGKSNHDISPSKLKIITTPNGISAFDLVQMIYNKLLENARKRGVENDVRGVLSDLNGMFEYIKQRENSKQIPETNISIKDVISNAITSGIAQEDVEKSDRIEIEQVQTREEDEKGITVDE